MNCWHPNSASNHFWLSEYWNKLGILCSSSLLWQGRHLPLRFGVMSPWCRVWMLSRLLPAGRWCRLTTCPVRLSLSLHLCSTVPGIKHSARNILVCVLCSAFIDVTAHKDRATEMSKRRHSKLSKAANCTVFGTSGHTFIAEVSLDVFAPRFQSEDRRALSVFPHFIKLWPHANINKTYSPIISTYDLRMANCNFAVSKCIQKPT